MRPTWPARPTANRAERDCGSHWRHRIPRGDVPGNEHRNLRHHPIGERVRRREMRDVFQRIHDEARLVDLARQSAQSRMWAFRGATPKPTSSSRRRSISSGRGACGSLSLRRGVRSGFSGWFHGSAPCSFFVIAQMLQRFCAARAGRGGCTSSRSRAADRASRRSPRRIGPRRAAA